MIANIAGYKFVYLEELKNLRDELLTLCQQLMLRGTILLSHEGINITLAGQKTHIASFKDFLSCDFRFNKMDFHETLSDTIPFKRLKIKIKKEIISLRKPEANPLSQRAPTISPDILKKWLDTNQDFTLLDTRNDYEIRFGTFAQAKHLSLSDFCEFPEALSTLDCTKPIVMFCTGGIRCEKAALYLLEQKKHHEVYQLDGGILGYFTSVGGAHYQGECFVFDERVSLDATLKETGTQQCINCQGPVSKAFTQNKQCSNCTI